VGKVEITRKQQDARRKVWEQRRHDLIQDYKDGKISMDTYVAEGHDLYRSRPT